MEYFFSIADLGVAGSSQDGCWLQDTSPELAEAGIIMHEVSDQPETLLDPSLDTDPNQLLTAKKG